MVAILMNYGANSCVESDLKSYAPTSVYSLCVHLNCHGQLTTFQLSPAFPDLPPCHDHKKSYLPYSQLPTLCLLEESQVFFSHIYPLFYNTQLVLGTIRTIGYTEVNPVAILPSINLGMKPQHFYDIRDITVGGKREDVCIKEKLLQVRKLRKT